MINPISFAVSISRKFYGYLKKDILLLVRRKKYFYLTILIPLLIGFLFLFFLNPSQKNIAIGICDHDNTGYSRQAVSDLRGFTSIFLPAENCTENLLAQLKTKEISLGIEIPNGFTQNLLNLKQAKIVVHYDNTDIAFANFVDWKIDESMQPYERVILNNLNAELKSRVSAIRTGVDFVLELTEDYNLARNRAEKVDSDLKKLEDIDTEFIVNPIWTDKRPIYSEQTKDAGLAFIFPVIVLFVVLMLSSSSLIYDKKANFLVRVKSSTSPIIYILAKLAFFFIVTLANFIIILFLFFAYGSTYSLSLLKILNLLAFISIINTLLGMLIGLISDNEGVAILFSFVISFPFMLLSGIFYPIQTMPSLMQYFAKIIPLNYQIAYSKSVLLFSQSIGFKWVWPALVLFITVYYLITRKH
jgi:hypothetical protein